MHRFAHAALFVAGVSAAIVAGPLLDDPINSVTAKCGQTGCSVGGEGTGGTASEGAAQGSYTSDPTNETGAVTQGGTDTSGRSTFDAIDGGPQTTSGRIDPATGRLTGHFVTPIFDGGVCNGVCPKP
jgi:hypothetical protein